MALPVWAVVTIVISITGGGSFALYQLRASVESVEEIFTDKDSALNNIALQAVVGAGAVWLISKLLK
jgi:hypothetical protein